MNADEADLLAESSDSGTMASTDTARYSAIFKQEPKYDMEELRIDEAVNIVITLHLELSRNINEVTAALRDMKNGHFLGSETKPGLEGDQLYTFSFASPVEVVANSLECQVFLELNQVGTVSYTFHTDGTSFVVLPLLRDTDSDGQPDTQDDDDDDDGFTDSEELIGGSDPLDKMSVPEGNDGDGDGVDESDGNDTWTLYVVLVAVLALVVVLVFIAIRSKERA